MATLRYQIPTAQEPVLDASGRFSRSWYNFLVGVSTQIAANVADIAGGSTLAQTITAFNALKDALVVSNQMEPD